MLWKSWASNRACGNSLCTYWMVISFWCVNHIDSLNMRSDCYYSNVYSWKHKWYFSVCTSISLLRQWWLWLLVPSSHCSADSKRQDLWSFYKIKHSFLEISEKCLGSQICDVPPFRITCYILVDSLGISHKHFFASLKKKSIAELNKISKPVVLWILSA